MTRMGPEPDRPEDREAVRAAEQEVSDAWIGRLLLAESETEAVLGACTRVRQRALARVRSTRRSDKLAEQAQAQTELDLAEAAWGRAVGAHEHARARLARELATWGEGTARRVRQALSDQPGTGRR